ncbi:hypothetical protein LUZ63_003765 [Rhynchospora breviuscula]|uniref:Uncharacterized protein n=1 Tax=Rhynchospora breviuscula TaxID=2022672 RepID=A0A9Q0D184_9POAL|nr:hypothetical protein LUZ63_003765 [Rhynchospora breviuscula]
MAEAVVRYVLGKITEAAYEEALLLYGVGDKVEWAKRELQWVSAFLKDADAKQNKDARVKQWVEDVKEVAYMIEDALDKFFVRMGGGRSKDALRWVAGMPKALIVKHEVGTEINKIKQRMSEIEKNVTLFELEQRGNSSSSRGGSTRQQPVRPVVVPEIDKTEVIGFQDDIDHICKQLLDQSISRRSVISIVGAGGRGKTTLATKIYKSVGVGHRFDCRIWISVSQDIKIINIVKKMLEKLQINAREFGDEEYFITQLHMSLRKKRYLIVLDDVWSSDHWTRLEVALPEDHNGSRVLITTRFVNVAKESDAANKPYELRILSEDESQQLLLKKIFPNQPENKCPNNLLPLVNQFAQKCGGWPLALVVLGGILSTKDLDYNIWNEILSKLDWQIEGSKCLDIISTSYDDLPIHLKQCFMYIASFPEDYKMRAATLIQLWIAEGIIQHESTTKMEKTAESYMEELVQRCMIQVSKRSWSGRIKYCYIHDILRELAILKSKENNFLQVFSKYNVDSTPRISASTHRIAFHECVNTELPIGLIGPNLRSLIHFRLHLPNYNKLTMVRVLHLEYSRYMQDHNDNPKWLKYLTALRYFQSNIEFYPCKMPTSFWNNMMLRYVKMAKGSFVMGPPSSANLVNLVTLKGVVARGGWKVKLPHFPRIRKLGIFVGLHIDWEALTNSMAKLEHLESLSVTFDRYEVFTPGLETITDHQRYRYTPAFKSYVQVHSLRLNYSWPRNIVCDSSYFPPHLVKLTLKNSYLEQDLLSALEKLPCLKVLCMLDFSYRGKHLVFYARGFKSLQQLKISCLLNLLEFKVEEGAMPMLNLLKIRYCIQLEMVPDLQYLTNLRELKLREMSYEFMSKLKGADQHKVKHIPSVNIY